jgi:hypothetical protein
MNEGISRLFGMFDVGWEVVKFLAVVGGVATGGLASGWLLRLFGGMATRRKIPTLAMATVRGLGGVGAGLAVWFWVSGTGGGGPGQGGYLGSGDGGPPAPRLFDKPAAKHPPAPEKSGGPGVSEGSVPDTVRIELLGGPRVQDSRFYLVEGQKEARALTDLRKLLEQRLGQKGAPRLKSIELVIYQNSVAEDHAAVRDLRDWARERDLDVKVVSVDRDLP